MHQPHLLDTEICAGLLRRLNQLTPTSQALWGEMNVAQMLAHVALNLESAMSDRKTTQALLGRLFGRWAKQRTLTNGVPRNIPTDRPFKVTDHRQFQTEKDRVIQLLHTFLRGGEGGITHHPHTFFGRMTPQEWSRLQYVHLDHHFRQFGV